MTHRTTAVAALMLALGASAAFAQAGGAAYRQVDDLASGRTAADTGYDGTPAVSAVRGQVSGALATGGLSTPAVAPMTTRQLLAPKPIPAPTHDAAADKASFFSSRSLMFGGAGAAVGAIAGWLLGGPIGALIGAAAGFGIGFLLSKVLH